MTNILDINDAVKELSEQLNKGYPLKVRDLNRARYRIAYFKDETALIVYKREMFHSLGKEISNTGYGESVNVADLNYCNIRGIKIVYFVYPDKKIYQITTDDIINNAVIRETNAEGKETYSFDVKLLKRMNPCLEATH